MEELVSKFAVWYVFYVLVLLFLFRKYLYSVFDPAIFVILMMASCLALSKDSTFFYYILLACGGFYFGVVNAGKIKRNVTSPVVKTDFMLLEFFSIGVFLLYLTANIILYKDAPIPLFSNNATQGKIAIFGAGSGWIRRVIFFSSFIPIGLSLLIILTLSKVKRALYIIMLLTFIFISVLLGSKSGFLGIFYIIWLLYTQDNLWNKQNIRIRRFIKKNIKYLLIGSIFIFLMIVYNENRENLEFLVFSLGFRLMEFGDVMLYYKIPTVRQHFIGYNFLDFLSNEFNGILGMLRVATYKEPLGYLMQKFYNGGNGGDVITGPNTVFLVRGHIFFGYLGGIVYCFFIGYLFALIRKKVLQYKISNVFVYAVLLFLFFNLDGFLREFSQYFSVMFDFIIYTGALFLASLILKDYFLKLRKTQI